MTSELFVSRIGCQTWAALRENGTLIELRVEEPDEEGSVGRIVKARVSKILPGIQSAFVDVGLDRDAYLHASDLLPPGEAPIQDRLKEGCEILVQVEREGLGSKGARVTGYLTLPGRYLVYLPQVADRGISRRITEEDERVRLEGLLETLPAPTGSFIVRTAARGASESCLRSDASMLVKSWEGIQERFASACAPSTVHVDLGLALRLLRDSQEGPDAVVMDDADLYQRALHVLGELDPMLATRVRLHTGPGSLFDLHGLSQEIRRALRPKVWLRSGGYLVIEQTEALVSIDVNTGKFVGKRQHEETVLRTNLEAAVQIARQLRLRDLGGIVVVDFIDMASPDSRRQVQSAFEEALRKDPARTRVVGLSELGLMQLTRKRSRQGPGIRLTSPCPLCSGRGRIKSPRTLACEALPEIRRLLHASGGETITVRAHPDVAREVDALLRAGGAGMDAGSQDRIQMVSDSSSRPDHVEVLGI